MTFKLAEPAGDVGFDIAALARAKVVEDGFEWFFGTIYRVMENGGAHGAGALDAFPWGWGFEGEVGDFDRFIGAEGGGQEEEGGGEGDQFFHGRW